MYAIYGNMYHQYTPNVSIYTIHGSYGIYIYIYIYHIIISNNLTPPKWAHQRFQWLHQEDFLRHVPRLVAVVALTKPQDKSSSRLVEVRDQQDNSIRLDWFNGIITGNLHDFFGQIDGFQVKKIPESNGRVYASTVYGSIYGSYLINIGHNITKHSRKSTWINNKFVISKITIYRNFIHISVTLHEYHYNRVNMTKNI